MSKLFFMFAGESAALKKYLRTLRFKFTYSDTAKHLHWQFWEVREFSGLVAFTD